MAVSVSSSPFLSSSPSPRQRPLSLDSLREPLLLRIVDFLVQQQPPREAAKQLALLDMVHRKFCYSSMSLTELVAREICYCGLPPGVGTGFAGRSWKWSVFVADTTLTAVGRRYGGEYVVGPRHARVDPRACTRTHARTHSRT